MSGPPFRGGDGRGRFHWFRMVLAGLTALFLAVVVFLYRTDQNLKRGDSFPGMAPENADWVMFAPDFPAAWRRFEGHPVGGLLRDYYPRAQSEAVLAARLATGVRPTPGRWSAWLGRSMMLGWRGGEWGACLRPGLLLRAALRGAESLGGPHALFGLYHAWRDGLLLLSPSREYVRDAVAAPPVQTQPSDDINVDVGWFVPGHETELWFELAGAGAIHYTGRLSWDGMPSDTGERSIHVPAWPDSPAISLTVSDVRLIGLFLPVMSRMHNYLLGDAPISGVLSAITKRWGSTFPSPTPSLALAWHGVQWSGAVPFPRMAALWQGLDAPEPHPLFQVARQDPASRPFMWAGHEGLLFPLMGPDMTICLLPTDDNRLLAATQETLMHRLAGEELRQESMRLCMHLRINGALLAKVLEESARRAAEMGWIPEMAEQDLELDVLPIFRVLNGLGILELQGTPDTGGMRVEGTLGPASGPTVQDR